MLLMLSEYLVECVAGFPGTIITEAVEVCIDGGSIFEPGAAAGVRHLGGHCW